MPCLPVFYPAFLLQYQGPEGVPGDFCEHQTARADFEASKGYIANTHRPRLLVLYDAEHWIDHAYTPAAPAEF